MRPVIELSQDACWKSLLAQNGGPLPYSEEGTDDRFRMDIEHIMWNVGHSISGKSLCDGPSVNLSPVLTLVAIESLMWKCVVWVPCLHAQSVA